MSIENSNQTARAVELLFTFFAIGLAVMVAGGTKLGSLFMVLGLLLAIYATAFGE